MTRVPVNPDLLHWAMQRACTSADALSGKFPRLDEWLQGKLQPTLKQLEEFAKATHTAIGYFFLSVPPMETLPIPGFRTRPEAQLQQPSVDLLETIYLCQQRQTWYRDYSLLHGEEPVAFVGSARPSDDVVEVAAQMRGMLGFDLDERRQITTWTEALRSFIQQTEDAGVLVMVSGIVASNTHRPLNPDEFRGFALVDDRAPLVFINGKDTKAAQMFTLAHELAHLWLGTSGVSDSEAAVMPDEVTERWCNAVAAELLAPLAVVRQELRPEEKLPNTLQRLARQFKVSTLVVLRRLFDAGNIDRPTFQKSYQEELERLKKLKRSGSGGDFYNTLGARVGKRLARALIVSTLEGQNGFTEAFRLLGVRKTSTFYEEARRLGVQG